MDAWSAEQLKRMQLGGNDALNNFLNKYGVDKFTDIKEKYNSGGAEVSCKCMASVLYPLLQLFSTGQLSIWKTAPQQRHACHAFFRHIYQTI